MLHFALTFCTAVVLFCIPAVHASDVIPPTRRAIQQEAAYRNALESIRRRAGDIQERPEAAEIQDARSLQRALAPPPQSETPTGATNAQRMYRTPLLHIDEQPSAISEIPVDLDAQVAYRNGIRYIRGDAEVQRDLSYAFMWLNFALAQGHPFARSALRDTVRHMSPEQLIEAQESTRMLTPHFLPTTATRAAAIRDAQRTRDITSLLSALLRYQANHAGMLPDALPADTAMEICRSGARSCEGMFNPRSLIPDYILAVHADPAVNINDDGTGYFVTVSEDGALMLFALLSEQRFAAVAHAQTVPGRDAAERSIPLSADEARGIGRWSWGKCIHVQVRGFSAPLPVAFTTTCLPWSPAMIHWDFGDGTSAYGLRVLRVYDKPGTYTVRVTAQGLESRHSAMEITVEVP